MGKNDATVSDRLKQHCIRLSKDLLADYRDTLHSGTPEIVADYRESFVQEVIGRFFPRSYNISKGAIYDSYGCRSASIDCVVCTDNHPLFLDALGRNTTLLADAVHCAIEVKPDLSDQPKDYGESRKQTPELMRGLKQVQEVKRLKRRNGYPVMSRGTSKELQDYWLRVPSYLFSMESVDIAALCRYTAGYYSSQQIPVEEQVDMMVVLGAGVIVNSKYPEKRGLRATDDGWCSLLAFDCGDDALLLFLLHAVTEVAPSLMDSPGLLGTYIPGHIWPDSWRKPVEECPSIPGVKVSPP
jgi:hypothetical protein